MALDFYDLYCEEVEKNESLEKKYSKLQKLYKSEETKNKYLIEHMEDMIEKENGEMIKSLETEIVDLKNEVARLKGLLNNDSTNSGISTSKTPINKNKRIPNSRKKSNKKKGAQVGHKKNKLSRFEDDEITEIVEHKKEVCSLCSSEMVPTGKVIYKDEFEFKIVLKKIRHAFIETKCVKCGNVEMISIPVRLKEENQYGSNVQALALTMMNQGFVSMNRTREIISGLTNNEINLSEGYISKLQKRLAKSLESFIQELKLEIIKLKVLHWDDTVISISTNRACLRFYGDEKLSLYTAHAKKDKIGLDEDNILKSLDKETVVVHDHNMVNYNDDYEFLNAECCAHVLRDLKKIVDNLGHKWAKDMVNLLISSNVDRNQGKKIDSVRISVEYDKILKSGIKENNAEDNKYYVGDEKTLIRRLTKYKDNYLMWTVNEDIPFTNNISERSLRDSKTKMKVSGQFDNLKSAEAFAIIKSYITTGRRNGMNPVDLIVRALEGNPVTVKEMKEHDANNN